MAARDRVAMLGFVAAVLATAATQGSAMQLPDPKAAKVAVACQRSIVQGGIGFVSSKLQGLDACVTRIRKCVEAGSSAKCLGGARRGCETKLARGLELEVRLASRIGRACRNLSANALRDASGLDFNSVADSCLQGFGTDVSDLGAIATCIVRAYARAVERLFAVENPRALEWLGAAQASTNTLCYLPANDGCDGCPAPAGSADTIGDCAAGVERAGRGFARQALGVLVKCVAVTFDCVQNAREPEKADKCRDKASLACDKAFAKIAGRRAALDATLVAKCGALPFPALRAVSGLNLGALVDVCAARGVAALTSVADYARCLRQQHECTLRELGSLATPRLAELLALIGPLPDALCTQPVPLASARIAERLGSGDIRDIISGVRDSGSRAGGVFEGGILQPTGGASNQVRRTETGAVVSPRRRPVKVAYSRCGDPAVTPRLIVTARDPDDNLVPGHYRVPLTEPEGEAEVEIVLGETARGCIRLAFATDCGGAISGYVVREEQRELPASPTPISAPTQTPAPTATPTPVTLTFGQAVRNGQGGVVGLTEISSLIVSPDGRHVYATGTDANAGLAIFSRAAAASLAFVEGTGDPRQGSTSLAISPDGKHVYLGSFFENSIETLARNETTGALESLDVQSLAGGVPKLVGPTDFIVTPDGKHLYLAAQQANAVLVFRRDLATGLLTFVQAAENGVAGVSGLTKARDVTVSSDGLHVYVAGFVDDAIAVFSRDPATGQLAFVDVERNGQDGVSRLDGPISLVVSPDGTRLYAAANNGDAILVFARNPASGRLAFLQLVQDGVDGVDGLDAASVIRFSPDAQHLYCVASSDDSLATFERDAEGLLHFVGVKRDGIGGVDGLDGAFALAVSPDGRSVYGGGFFDAAIAVFSTGP